jgi:DNA-binding transcriptional MocR family regulator
MAEHDDHEIGRKVVGAVMREILAAGRAMVVWLPLPPRCGRAEFLRRVLDRGLAVVAGDAFAVDPASAPAVRVSLGAPHTRAELAQGLHALAETFTAAGRGAQVI